MGVKGTRGAEPFLGLGAAPAPATCGWTGGHRAGRREGGQEGFQEAEKFSKSCCLGALPTSPETFPRLLFAQIHQFLKGKTPPREDCSSCPFSPRIQTRRDPGLKPLELCLSIIYPPCCRKPQPGTGSTRRLPRGTAGPDSTPGVTPRRARDGVKSTEMFSSRTVRSCANLFPFCVFPTGLKPGWESADASLKTSRRPEAPSPRSDETQTATKSCGK